MSQMFEIIGNAALAYGASLAPNPIMKVRFTVEPNPSDVGLSEWQIGLALECYGEIIDGKPKLLDSVLWEGHGEGMAEALVDLHLQVQSSVVKRVQSLQNHLAALNLFVTNGDIQDLFANDESQAQQDIQVQAALDQMQARKDIAEAAQDPDNVVIKSGEPGQVVSVSAVLRPAR